MTEQQKKALMFFIPGPPRGKGRPRATGRGQHAAVYTDSKTAAYENLVRIACHQAMVKTSQEAFAGPVSVSVACKYPINKGASKRKLGAFLAGEERPTKKPDLDNVLKAVLDGINGVAFADDAQVVSIVSDKYYGIEPGVHVTIEALDVEKTLRGAGVEG